MIPMNGFGILELLTTHHWYKSPNGPSTEKCAARVSKCLYMKFMLLFVLLFSGCHKISVPARETFYELFPISLPNEVALREFHTNFANENDLMFAVQFRSEQECLIYNTKWGISTGMSGKEQLFQIVKGEIQATDFGDLLIREGWPMSLADYTACEGRIKSGKIAQVFVHREKMLIVLFG